MDHQDMDEFLVARKVLEDRGLSVSVVVPNERLHVRREGDGDVTVFRLATHWRVGRRDYAPGPGPDDFSATFATLDETLLAVWGYFFGKSIRIDDWIIPMHRRPFWTLGRLQYRLANVVHVRLAAFDAIREQRAQCAQGAVAKKGPGLGDRAEARLFLRCDHVSQPGLRLMLRRDLEEGYVVDAS